MSSTINPGALVDLSESTPMCPSGTDPGKPHNFAAAISKNILASLVRVMVVSLVALVLPAYLTHHLPVTTYAAWILILEMGAYISYLDLGVQTAVSKFVAEYDANQDHHGAGQHASAGLVLMLLAGILGVVLTCVLAWQVPRLFSAMPANLYRDVRISVLLIGFSLSFGLVCAAYSAVFLGLQHYWIPMTITIANRVSFAVVIIVVVALHGNLAVMGAAVASINVVSGLTQIVAWHKRASHIPISVRLLKLRVFKSVARFCTLQSVWTIAMLCITGLDITIVGHYDYPNTAYYSIAALPTTFVLMMMSSLLGPIMPASSAMSTQRSPAEMGSFLVKVTRYSTLVLLLTGLPLIVYGLPLLGLWVGSAYASHTVQYLRILVLANIIRNLCAPYATMITATNQQGAATVAAISEAAVNLGSSIYLAVHFGAIGVAFATLLGAFVSVLLHFAISMHYTFRTVAISRVRLFFKGLMQPAIIAAPSIIIMLFFASPAHIGLVPVLGWAGSTILLAWFAGLKVQERNNLIGIARKRLVLQTTSG
ncbi:MAG TPA: polysaccharide biosynthesis C-terminal domain-containing protein [Terriglobales bacterium]|jgi:O-antigen/teichoic acid export membrane protein